MSTLPSPDGMARAYKILLKKESLAKPASVTKRQEILQAQQRTNYKNEYDRILGLLAGYADRFARPGGGHDKQKLLNRQNELKRLFRLSHHHDDHPIRGKGGPQLDSASSSMSSSRVSFGGFFRGF
jgi:hypothetical protein